MKKAFSLIEVSIVILIIGILISAISQGGVFINKSRLSNAQSLTQNSVVNHISDLVAWYETSLESSFPINEQNDQGFISTWYDNSPGAITRNNATQSANTNKPKFYENIFNGAIPGIRFDGSNDLMPFDGSAIINSSYTIFVVEQRRSSASSNYFLGGTTLSQNQNLVLGYRNNTTVTQAHFSNDMDVTIAAYSSPKPTIHTFQFDSTNGKKYWSNGGATPDATNSGQTAAITSYTGSALGRYNTGYYNGDLAEVIIFKRILKGDERQNIENYLSKKYGISIS